MAKTMSPELEDPPPHPEPAVPSRAAPASPAPPSLKNPLRLNEPIPEATPFFPCIPVLLFRWQHLTTIVTNEPDACGAAPRALGCRRP